MMKKFLAVAVATFSLVTGAEAALVGRDINGIAVASGDASSVFLYDTVLNVTWLRDANYAQTSGYSSTGNMNWAQANTWAANLTVGSYGGWRLPTMTANPNTTFSDAGGTDRGYNVRTKSGDPAQYQAGQTVYSEMASLFYSTLGNLAYCNPVGSAALSCNGPQPGYGLTHTGDFKNLQSYVYWSGLEYSPPSSFAWYFNTSDNSQDFTSKGSTMKALAVRSGDVLTTSAVPIPAAAWLMLSGIGALGAAARRRKAE